MTNTEYEALQEEVTEIKLREALERVGVDGNAAKAIAVGMTCQDGKLMKMGMERWHELEWQTQKAELERQWQEEQRQKQQKQTPEQGIADLERQVAAAMGLSEPEQEPEQEDLFLKGFNNGY